MFLTRAIIQWYSIGIILRICERGIKGQVRDRIGAHIIDRPLCEANIVSTTVLAVLNKITGRPLMQEAEADGVGAILDIPNGEALRIETEFEERGGRRLRGGCRDTTITRG